ncbi:ran-specific GTPase-activating protein-like [Ischnura elegans]|uniref:ran-specific GTPase-activating protein-like n=1 Tax=Ischnura elegans TaxID=197161 RepID=UPI001ED8BDA8|nr:ran-specific GTPase-activating protein-like [Ischnura elegans]
MEHKMNGEESKSADSAHDTSAEHDVHFEPIITLPEVIVSTLEENEDELIKLRAKLFRYDTSESPPEWKERGTGEVKLLHNPDRKTVRVVMRRDKTLKICANHFVAPWMELKPNCGSDRAWVWSVSGDLTDDTPRNELLAIRFANAENALKWKEAFEEAKTLVASDRECDNKTDEDDKEESDTESVSDASEDQPSSQGQDDTLTKDLEKLDIGRETSEGSPKKSTPEKKSDEVEKKTFIETADSKSEEAKDNTEKAVDS